MKTVNRSRALAFVLIFAAVAGAQTVWDGKTLDTLSWFMASSPAISTPERLAGLAYLVNTGKIPDLGKKTFTLTCDIALNVIEDRPGDDGKRWPWTAIGTKDYPFQGTFDGAGFFVRGVYINKGADDYQGLFGNVAQDGVIKKLRVEVVADSSIKGRQYVGGLAGKNSGKIEDCFAVGAIVGTGDDVGGLVGLNKGKITNSSATGSVTGFSRVGGLVGFGENDTIGDSYAVSSAVSSAQSAGWCIGGLVGKSSGYMINVYATGTAGPTVPGVVGSDSVGGLVGSSSAMIVNSYAIIGISGDNHVGGFAGAQIGGEIVNSYAVGKVLGINKNTTGGFVGFRDHTKATITYGYYDNNVAGAEDKYGIPKTTLVMQSDGFAKLLNVAAYARSTENAKKWNWSQSGQYPTLSDVHLVSQKTFSDCFYTENATGSADKPYIIATALHLEYLAVYVNCRGTLENARGKVFKLRNNILLNSDTASWRSWGQAKKPSNIWTAIGQQSSNATNLPKIQFNATFDGAGFVVGGIYINKSDTTDIGSMYQGLFGQVGKSGEIKNLGVIASYINGTCYVGGVAGLSMGAVTDCFVKGNVSASGGERGGGGVGGLLGKNDSAGIVTNCYSTGDVSGAINMAGGLVGWNCGGGKIIYCYAIGNVRVTGDDVGGLVGRNDNSSVIDSYAAGNVTGLGKQFVGGLVGINIESVVTRCYAVGNVTGNTSVAVGGLVGIKWGEGRIDSSYYRVNAAAVGSDYGIARTADEMKRKNTYEGWDFNAVWDIDAESHSYPYLAMTRAVKPAITKQPVGSSVKLGAVYTMTVEAAATDGGKLSYQWYSNRLDSNSDGAKINGATNASYTVPTTEAAVTYYYAVVANTITGSGAGQKTASVASNAVKVTVTDKDAVLSPDRVIPESNSNKESAAISPPTALTVDFAVGPNPAKRGAGVDFFRKGKRISSGELWIYDASGNTVNKIKISDRAAGKVGSWNLTDAKGRKVPEGTYLVKGVIITDGKRETVSITVGVK